jgi:hypothetical protein
VARVLRERVALRRTAVFQSRVVEAMEEWQPEELEEAPPPSVALRTSRTCFLWRKSV